MMENKPAGYIIPMVYTPVDENHGVHQDYFIVFNDGSLGRLTTFFNYQAKAYYIWDSIKGSWTFEFKNQQDADLYIDSRIESLKLLGFKFFINDD